MNWTTGAIFLISSLVFVTSQSCLSSNIGHWVSAEDGFVPPGAVVGGVDKERPLYICRSHDICGKIYDHSSCYYAESKKEIKDNHYEVLTDVAGVWISPVSTKYPCNMLMTGDNLYSCRVTYKKALTIGKLEKGICIIPYGGKSHKFKKDFEVFTALSVNLTLKQKQYSSVYNLTGEYLTFQLKAGNECVVYFGKGDTMLIRVAIGGLNNSVVSIGPAGQPYEVIQPAANILSDSKFNSFWTRWISKNTLEFGREGDNKPLAKYTRIGVKDIDSFQLYSTFGNSEWKVPQ